jgi:hypothetical protein
MPIDRIYIIRTLADEYHAPGLPTEYYLTESLARAAAEKLSKDERPCRSCGHLIKYYVDSLREAAQD